MLCTEVAGGTATCHTGTVIGEADGSTYRTYEYKNGFRSIFVQHPGARNKVVAMEIDAGGEHDEYPGIAHLLEHMLLVESEKYPAPYEIRKFLGQCGSAINAYTMLGRAVYVFVTPSNIGSDQFREALDRFMQMFIVPTLPEDRLDAEIDAVDSEYREKLATDGMRISLVEAMHTSPGHPAGRFFAGNRETLARDETCGKLHEFFRRHYVPENMILTVYGDVDIIGFLGVVDEYALRLGERRTHGSQRPWNMELRPFPPEILTKILWVRSTNNMKELCIKYVLSSEALDHRTKMYKYVANILSYNGKGSLFSLLKRQRLATDLCTHFIPHRKYEYGSFSIVVSLTDKGLEQYKDVACTVLKYIERIKRTPVWTKVLEEEQFIQVMRFNLHSNDSDNVFEEMMELGLCLRDYGAREMVSGRFLISEIDAGRIQRFLDAEFGANFIVGVLDPRSASATDTSADGSTLLRERWSGAEYSVEQLDASAYSVGEDAEPCVFPPENEFLPNSPRIGVLRGGARGARRPRMKLYVHGDTKMWFREDSDMAAPIVSCAFAFMGQYRMQDRRSEAKLEMFCVLMRYVLSARLYGGFRAGYKLELNRPALSTSGVEVYVCGMSEKVGRFSVEAVCGMLEAEIEEGEFEMAREIYREEVVQDRICPPEEGAERMLESCLVDEINPIVDDVARLVDEISIAEMRSVADEFFGDAKLEMVVCGRISVEEATAMQGEVATILGKRRIGKRREPWLHRIVLPQDRCVLFHARIPGSGSHIHLYVEICDLDDLRGYALLGMFNMATRVLYFEKMRVEQSIGYTVQQKYFRGSFGHILDYHVRTELPTDRVYRVMCEFIEKDTREAIFGMSNERFAAYKSIFAGFLRDGSDTAMSIQEPLGEILHGTYNFRRREETAEILATLRKSDLVSFWEERLMRGKRREVCIAMAAEDGYGDMVDRLETSAKQTACNPAPAHQWERRVEPVVLAERPLAEWKARQEKRVHTLGRVLGK